MKQIITIVFLFALKATAQDTTITVRTYACDSVVTTTLPQRIIYVGDTLITATDTSYNIFFDTRQYVEVTRDSLPVPFPIYDTIPAHDTTFTCHLCATCSRSDTVIHTDTTKTLYGVFIINDPQTSLPSRLHQAKSIHAKCVYYRYNSDRGEVYRVKQVKDSGLFVSWVFQNRPVSDVAYFPTGAALTAFTTTIDSCLNVAKPDLLSIENEEAKAEYHKGTVQDYLNELNAATVVAHAHGVPISNGGTTQGVVYAMRRWYADRGRADSVAWLNNALGLPTNLNSTYGQTQEAWYIPLLAGFAASQIDYVNFHWYEPPRTDTTPVTTSGVLPPLINYLRIATGKKVITTESGCRNHSDALLSQMFTEIDGTRIPVAIYYDGVGSLAIQNEAGFKLFLNSLP